MPFEYENRLRRYRRPISLGSCPLSAAEGCSGTRSSRYGSATGIGDRERAEEALQRSEAYLAEAQRLSHCGSRAVNISTGEIIHSSDEHSRLYGSDPGKGTPSLGEFLERSPPEDRARVLQLLESASRA